MKPVASPNGDKTSGPNTILSRLLRRLSMTSGYGAFVILTVVFNASILALKIRLKSLTDDAPLYPLAVFFFLSPFFAVWALWVVLTSKLPSQPVAPGEDRRPRGLELPTAPLESSLLLIEREIVDSTIRAENRLARLELGGRLFAMLSASIPIITWFYALKVAQSKEHLANLWALTVSAASAGTVGVTIGVTLLRHAKARKMRLEQMDEEIIYLRKLRAVCVATEFSPEEKVRLETSIAKTIVAVGRGSSEPAPQPADEGTGSPLEQLLRLATTTKA